MSGNWFVQRSVLSVAAEKPCEDYGIAVGRTLGEQRTEANDWIFLEDLGGLPGYYRSPYDARCEPDFDLRFYTTDLTRPHDPGPRVDGLQSGAGFYLDLVDAHRPGPTVPNGVAETAPVYAERRDEGDKRVRITYWMLFGAHAPPRQARASREGDWERVDVLLVNEGDGRYAPEAVELIRPGDGAGAWTTQWTEARTADGTHPVILLARGSHTPSAMAAGERCRRCGRWPSWETVTDVRREPWYGFGGAWGEPGPTEATTGPLGPHGPWPTEAARERADQGL